MAKLLGIVGHGMIEPASQCDAVGSPSPTCGAGVQYLKQDLNNATILGHAAWSLHNNTRIVNESECLPQPPSSNNSNSFSCGNNTYGCDETCVLDDFECAHNVTTDEFVAECSCTNCNYTEPAHNHSAPVIAVQHVFTPAAGSSVIATLNDTAQTPAGVYTATGKGASYYFSFLPGLAYFKPAMPVRPTDRSGIDEGYTHFIPSNFSADVMALVKNVSRAAGAVPHVTCSNPLVCRVQGFDQFSMRVPMDSAGF